MVGVDVREPVVSLIKGYEPEAPERMAAALRALWLQFEPKSIAVIKREQRAQQETQGIPVPVLSAVGQEIGRVARKRVPDFVPLARLLWDAYGREGRVVAVWALGPMELADPQRIFPLARELCRTCITWEDADQLAMRALEPIVRKAPEAWLGALEPWLNDESKWVRRAAVVAFLARQVPPERPEATWVLCDVIRSMANKLLPEFVPLLSLYERWHDDPATSGRDARSVESALKTLRKAAS